MMRRFVGKQGPCLCRVKTTRSCSRLGLALVLWGLTTLVAHADDWPQWLGPKRDGIWRESGIIEKFPEGGPRILWRAPVGGGFSGPAVSGGRIYVTDRQLKSGASGQKNPFDRGRIEGTERVLCLNESNGELLWKHEYDCPYSISYASGPRTTPSVDAGRVYTLGGEGNLRYSCRYPGRGSRAIGPNRPSGE